MASFMLSDFLPYRLAVVASRMSGAYERRHSSDSGLSVPEWRVLAHLSQSSEVSVREIQTRVDMEKSKVSRAASRLEAQGLVAKVVNPNDRRLVSLSLTSEGKALMVRLTPIALQFQADVRALLGADAEQFEVSLNKLMKAKL
ncbi:winged helix-turn-helix transcriptional regulator [Rhizobium cauense]|uniref:MarR family winged helix-turn-helix transcriptional regulator n=1 Tax=Rhizobium cauense TaxID=1166683 RepID=UPI001C6E81AA|nr:MarR family winged helix-turn-helix transcriptional regulator [Rhizobium cauense]MBW9117018.1 winged helix-turn-helix transcriptional regulator [Rhizobium cauense]